MPTELNKTIVEEHIMNVSPESRKKIQRIQGLELVIDCSGRKDTFALGHYLSFDEFIKDVTTLGKSKNPIMYHIYEIKSHEYSSTELGKIEILLAGDVLNVSYLFEVIDSLKVSLTAKEFLDILAN